ncbi:unnamed protein product [Symbiodinium sp. CCMP2592]|nr:unnamed protein product [Symbiodinium sp. CCMP2592]
MDLLLASRRFQLPSDRFEPRALRGIYKRGATRGGKGVCEKSWCEREPLCKLYVVFAVLRVFSLNALPGELVEIGPGGTGDYYQSVIMAGTTRSPCSPTGGADTGGPPAGRKRPAQQDDIDDDDKPLTLSTLLAALKENREEIVAQVREDIDGLTGRVTTVEQTVEAHVSNTTRLLEAMTDRHCAMEASVRGVDERQQAVVQRLEALEGRFAQANFSLSSTRTSDTDGGNQRPAIVVGGWSADQHHEDTLRLVKQHLQELNIDLDTSKAFVPGLRRGFALVPLTKNLGESDEEQRARVQEALRAVRAAKVVTGQKPEGGERYLFAAMSQSPERRKRAQLAGKVKRLIIEEGGDIRRIDVEYGTANLWYNSIKVASGVTSPPDGASVEKAGWVHLGTLARQIGISEAAATSKWGELRKALQ